MVKKSGRNKTKLRLLCGIFFLVAATAVLIFTEWESTGVLIGNIDNLFPNLRKQFAKDALHGEEGNLPISDQVGMTMSEVHRVQPMRKMPTGDDSSVASMGSIVQLAPVEFSTGNGFEDSALSTTRAALRSIPVEVPAPVQNLTPPLKCGSKTLPAMYRRGGRIEYVSRATPEKLMMEYLEVAGSAGKGEGPRIFCGIYTYDKSHETKARVVFDTWGKRCDRLVMYSNKEDASLNAIKLVVPMDAGKENLIQKLRKVWLHVYQTHLNDFDYFYISGDDTYVILDNLRAYLLRPRFVEANLLGIPLFLGRRFKDRGDSRKDFNTGGPGYVMNKKALKMVGNEVEHGRCGPAEVGWYEDTVLAECFRGLGVWPFDTRDERGRDFFHPFPPVQHIVANWEWLKVHGSGEWFLSYSYNLQLGFDCCAPNSISFHYVEPDLARRMDMSLYRHRNAKPCV